MEEERMRQLAERWNSAGRAGVMKSLLYTCVSIRQHTSAYVSIRQGVMKSLLYTSVSSTAYVSIRQHTSAYVSVS